MSAVLISLGSNLGGRAGYLRSALRKIAEFAAIERTSFLYETEPMHVLEQPRFLNAAAALRTTLTPHELLAALQSVERMLGRDHANGVRYGPRVIDLDIVRYGDWSEVVATDDLAIPHPRLAEREFVLRPLLDLVPDDIELRRMVGALEASSHPPRRVLAQPPRVLRVIGLSPTTASTWCTNIHPFSRYRIWIILFIFNYSFVRPIYFIHRNNITSICFVIS